MKSLEEYEKEIVSRQEYFKSIGFGTPCIVLSPLVYDILSKSKFSKIKVGTKDFTTFKGMKVCKAYKIGKDFIIEVSGEIESE